MKKLFYLLVTTLCITFLLTGCQAKEKTDSEGSNSMLSIEKTPFHFDTYEELAAFFTSDNSSENALAYSETKIYGAEFETLVNNILTGKTTIRIPYFAGQPFPIRDLKGYAKVSLFPYELYEKPVFWYHCRIDGQDVGIKIMHLSESVTEYAKDHLCSEVIRSIYPSAVNIDNYQQLNPNYRVIYEQPLQLADREASAMFCEVYDEERVRVFFAYDDVLVLVITKPDVMTNDFWSEFSLGDIT